MKYITTIGDQEYAVEILGPYRVSVNGQEYDIDMESLPGQPVHSLLVNHGSYMGHIYQGDDGEWNVLLRGTLYQARVEDEREQRLKTAGSAISSDAGEFVLKSPMPGLVVQIPVAEGDEVKQGQVLLVLESMKMQNELKSPRDGTVGRVLVKAGDSVEQKQTMLTVE